MRRIWENTTTLFPFLALVFLPLLFPDCRESLWKWWNAPAPGVSESFDAKRGYLSHGFFLFRYVGYFVVLGVIAYVLRSRSVEAGYRWRRPAHLIMRKLGVTGIPVMALCLTFGAFDWLMGLNYKWFSTMWGVYIFAGAAGSGMSLTVIIVTVLRSRGYLKPVNLEHYHIMGKYMLAFTIFWAYIGFSQYMLIWYANIPEETIYFRVRNTESWQLLSLSLVIGRFFLPFPILLTQWIKKQPARLCIVAAWILLMQFLDIYVIVLPSLHPYGFSPSVFDFFAFIGIGGIAVWLWLRVLPTAYLFPTRDPRLAASLNLTN